MNAQVVAITGAASGLGLALSQQFITQGHTVIAFDINAVLLDEQAAALGANFVPHVLDVTDAHAWEVQFNHVMQTHKKIDVLINNAGIMSSGEFENMALESWRKVVDINLMGVIYGAKAAYTIMKQQGFGRIVNVASTAGVTPVLYSTSYAATKHAVVGFSNSLREEARAHGIHVVLVVPGLIDTNIFDAALDNASKSSRYMADNTPIQKISPQRAAEYIIEGINRNKTLIVFPFINQLVVFLYRLMPRLMTTLIVKNQKHSE